MIHLRNLVRMLILLAVVFGIPIIAAMLTRGTGWSPRPVGWGALLLICALGWYAFRAERKGGKSGAILRSVRTTISPNLELPQRRRGSRHKGE